MFNVETINCMQSSEPVVIPYSNSVAINRSKSLPGFRVVMRSLDSINGRSIQTLLRGENNSKQSDEFQAKVVVYHWQLLRISLKIHRMVKQQIIGQYASCLSNCRAILHHALALQCKSGYKECWQHCRNFRKTDKQYTKLKTVIEHSYKHNQHCMQENCWNILCFYFQEL